MLIKQLFRRLTEKKWNIGFMDDDLESILNGHLPKIQWLKHDYKDRWFADPFILEVSSSEILVLVEELYYPLGRGRISRLTIDRSTMKLKKVDPVLTEKTHLSFPAIMRKDGKLFIYPENGASGKLVLYQYDPFVNSAVPVNVLASEKMGDAIISTLYGEKYMFCTVYPDYNGDELFIYRESEKDGSFVEYDKISFSGDKIARMAGDIFEYNNCLYRVAQNCNKRYGGGIVFQKISYKSEKFSFENVARYDSPNATMNLGFHTFNRYKDMVVVDSRGYRHSFIGPILDFLRDILR